MIIPQPETNTTGGITSIYESAGAIRGGVKSSVRKPKRGKSARKPKKQSTRTNKKVRRTSKKHKCNKRKIFTDKYKMNPTFSL
jgi:hypothetical protein